MAKFQNIGDKETLSRGPKNMDRSEFKSGEFCLVGDSVKMSQKPVPLQQERNGIRGGTYQKVGDSVTLGKTPIKGWQSFETPISTRAKFASEMPGRKKK
jgi:hypothetical protein